MICLFPDCSNESGKIGTARGLCSCHYKHKIARVMADKYRVSEATIHAIRNGYNWKHVTSKL